MKIGIIGAGNIGSTLARLLTKAGYSVALSNSRGPETLESLVTEIGGDIHAATAEEAARYGDIVIEAIPYGRYRQLPVDALAGKILVSAANYYPKRDGMIDFAGHTQTGLIAAYLPQTRVVKAFNTIYFKHLLEQGDTSKPISERRVIFIAGDDAEAKQEVTRLIEDLGFGVYDTGSLEESEVQEPGAEVYTKDMTVAEARALLG